MRYRSVAFMLLPIALGSCSPSNEHTLAGHTFVVPKLNDTSSDTLFFLPTPDPRDGFSFILNPDARLPDQVRVLIGSKARDCARAAGTKADIIQTICPSRALEWRDVALKRVGNRTFWNYELPATTSQKDAAVVARCSEMGTRADPKPGLCLATLPYKNLTISIGFRDNQATVIQSLYDRVVNDLRQWER